MLTDTEAVGAVLDRCFRKAGRDLVVVSGEREFRVWSTLLCEWSEVFQAMLNHEFLESTSSRIVIEDFSADSVEAFLRFMYSGSVEAKPELLVEVAALADKYGVGQLHILCSKHVEEKLTTESACGLLQRAHRLGASRIKNDCKQFICISAQKALPHAHTLDPDLLEELLSSSQLCIKDFDLAMILLGWAGLPETKVDVAALLQRHVEIAALTEEQLSQVSTLASTVNLSEVPRSMNRQRKRGEYTGNVFRTLWGRYEREFPDPGSSSKSATRPPFLGYWINLIPSASSFRGTQAIGYVRTPAQSLERAAAGDDVCMKQNEELVWMLPHHGLYVTEISFTGQVSADMKLEVFSSTDGQSWALLANISKAAGKVAVPCRAQDCATWFKLRVRQGVLNNALALSGILQDL